MKMQRGSSIDFSNTNNMEMTDTRQMTDTKLPNVLISDDGDNMTASREKTHDNIYIAQSSSNK